MVKPIHSPLLVDTLSVVDEGNGQGIILVCLGEDGQNVHLRLLHKAADSLAQMLVDHQAAKLASRYPQQTQAAAPQ